MSATEWIKKANLFAPVLVVAAERGVAQRLAEMMRGLGPVQAVIWAGDEAEALRQMETFNPKLIFIEQPGYEMDGLTLVKTLRHSAFACRQAPVVMMSDDATVGGMRGAQAVGAHEFLIRPFSALDLSKRLEVLCGAPRDWIESEVYIGPDRRRFNSAAGGPERRGRKKRPPITLGPFEPDD